MPRIDLNDYYGGRFDEDIVPLPKVQKIIQRHRTEEEIRNAKKKESPKHLKIQDED